MRAELARELHIGPVAATSAISFALRSRLCVRAQSAISYSLSLYSSARWLISSSARRACGCRRGAQRPADQLGLQRRTRRLQRERGSSPRAGGELCTTFAAAPRRDAVAVGQDHRALDHVLELAHVAGPAGTPSSRSIASALDRAQRFPRLAHVRAKKWSTSSGMSSGRSRSGGHASWTTLSR
jgi:hypothetical protein